MEYQFVTQIKVFSIFELIVEKFERALHATHPRQNAKLMCM